jgi:hypothetical protein
VSSKISPEIPFKIEVPIEVFEKAGEKGKERRIGGIISTEAKDKQGEVVLQRGLDFSDFEANGWFNDNHSRDTAGIVGYPMKGGIRRTTHNGKPATYVEGYLLQGDGEKSLQADRIWGLANALQKTDRRLGFSIEGKVMRRSGPNGKTIAQARVSNVAITNCPVNTDSGLDVLAKSMMALEGDENAIEALKALAAGNAIAAPAEPTPGDGFALRGESLEGGPKKRKRKKKQRLVAKSEAIEFIRRRHPGLSAEDAERIWHFAKRRSE